VLVEDVVGALLRVLPAPQNRYDEIRLVSLDLHERGFVIRWEAEPGSAGAQAAMSPTPLMALTLHDDLNTRYERVGGAHGFNLYRPAIPPEATWLNVTKRDEVVLFLFGQDA
jgi:hypothetical protein